MTREEAKTYARLAIQSLKNDNDEDTIACEFYTCVLKELSTEPQIGEWEVYEVLHGEWDGTKKYRCSRCKHKVGVFNTNFCPECGLKMSNGKSWERSNMKGDKE